MIWVSRHPSFNSIEMLGAIPSFLSEYDPRDARTQINEAYAFAGGWQPFPNFVMLEDGTLIYPGDPPLPVLCSTRLRDEKIYYYQHSWLAIVQPDGSYEVARLD
jgi:hypothetical protein